MKFRTILSIFVSILLFLIIGETIQNLIHFSYLMPAFVRRFAPENAAIFSIFSPELLLNLAKAMLAYGFMLGMVFITTIILPLYFLYLLIRLIKDKDVAKKFALKALRFISLIFIILWLVFSLIASTTEEQFSLFQAFLEFLFMFSVFFKFRTDSK